MRKDRLIKSTMLGLGIVGAMLVNMTSAADITTGTVGGIDVITICESGSTEKCITLMDKNLGAMSNDITSTGSYGYHYQWGNNHGFAPCLDSIGCDTFLGDDTMTTDEHIDTTSCGPLNYFSGNVFRKITSSPFDRSETRNDNLWGGSGDSEDNNRGYDTGTMQAINVTDRQGPCPTNYHVPSRGEWTALMDLYSNGSTNGDIEYSADFQNAFNLSLAGVRRGNTAKVDGITDYLMIWSSSPNVGGENAWSLAMNPGKNYIFAKHEDPREAAFSVRCFKNSSVVFLNVSFYDGTGNDKIEVYSGIIQSGQTMTQPDLNLSKPNSYLAFDKWYTDVELTQEFGFDTPITGDLELYAGWKKSEIWIDRNGNPFSWGEDITICDLDDSSACITIMDRNLGASMSSWRDSFGYYYQWGNNYGFDIWGSDVYTTNEKAVWDDKYKNHGYYGALFVQTNEGKKDYWSGDMKYDSLWGGENDSEENNRGYDLHNYKERQGPCPEGWHVPSIGEWGMLMKFYRDNFAKDTILSGSDLLYEISDGSFSEGFRNYFALPLASRIYGEILMYDYWVDGVQSWTRSSSPYFDMNKDSSSFLAFSYGGVSVIEGAGDGIRGNAYAIRCFKNLEEKKEQEEKKPISVGGGGSTLRKDNCPNGDFSDSYYDGTCGTKPQNDKEVSSGVNEEVVESSEEISSSEGQGNNELQTAYEFAYKNGITTMDTIEKADMEGSLTRIAMAKMLSKYAINVLGKKPANTIVPQFSDVTVDLNAEYDDGVTLAYQLGIMGINMPGNKFRPFDLVPRSEFVTALSRMKYGTPDGEYVGTAEYYKNHMEILSNEGIVSLLDPKMLELRGYVMLMLMRSEK